MGLWSNLFGTPSASKTEKEIQRILRSIAAEKSIFLSMESDLSLVKDFLKTYKTDDKINSKIEKALKKLKQDIRYLSRSEKAAFNSEKVVDRFLKETKITDSKELTAIRARLVTEVNTILVTINVFKTEIGLLLYNFDHLAKIDPGTIEALIVKIEETIKNAEQWITSMSADTIKAEKILENFKKEAHSFNEETARELIKVDKIEEALIIYEKLQQYKSIINAANTYFKTEDVTKYPYTRTNEYKIEQCLIKIEGAYQKEGKFEESIVVLWYRLRAASINGQSIELYADHIKQLVFDKFPSQFTDAQKVTEIEKIITKYKLIKEGIRQAITGIFYRELAYREDKYLLTARNLFIQAKVWSYVDEIEEKLIPEGIIEQKSREIQGLNRERIIELTNTVLADYGFNSIRRY